MDIKTIEEVVKNEEIYIDDPSFYVRAFSYACHIRKKAYALDGDNFKRIFAEEYDALSKRTDRAGIQDSCSVRNVLRTRRLANLLINDKGEVNFAVIPRLIGLLKQHLYSLGPNRQHDSKRQLHLLNVLKILNENKEIQRILKNIDKPISNRNAEMIIRDTLLLPPNISVTDAHTRRACLSAWMCMLRQNVGSCFATAPAIIIQSEQPAIFFKDLLELLNTGRLKRTFGGIEYSVPLSTSWGAGDLKRPFVFSLNERGEKSQIWQSPALEDAFEAAGLIYSDASSEDKMEKMKILISSTFEQAMANQPYALITAEKIIRKVLLKTLNLTEQDILDYENRPKAMMSTSLIMNPVAISGAAASKGQLFTRFQEQLAQAERALKGLSSNALLKSWEFSLASFAETKAQFTRWNLYSSLGLGANEKGGIGACLYEVISRKLEQANRRVQEIQTEYEIAYLQIKTMESRVRSVSSEKEANWLKAEYQSKRNEFFSLEEMRDRVHHKAQRLAGFFDELIKQYYDFFTRYFQEVYDADMHDVTTGPFDDSPAGFRLLYKYGRSNTSQWSLIYNANQFVDSLASFFTAIELELSSMDEFEGLQNDLSEITTAVVNHVRTPEFIETAFYRMAIAHKAPVIKNPLEHLDRIDKKPWAYTSGGGMDTLIGCYFKLDNPPIIISRWVENPIELLVFFIDTIKQIPPKIIEEYLNNSSKSMLMQSPTHAFLLKPGEKIFKCAWKNDVFTYTWVRDHLIAPRKKMLTDLELSEPMTHYLIQKLAVKLPENYQHYFKKYFGSTVGTMSPKQFRNHLLQGMQKERGLKSPRGTLLSEDEIDSMLFSMLPLFPRAELRERLKKLYEAIPEIAQERREALLQVLDQCTRYTLETIVDASQLQDIAKGLICLTFAETTSEIDYHALIAAAAQKLGYALQAPLIFADTNWVEEDFGFVVNPGNGNLELWRCDPIGREGHPMSSWEQWLNGSRRDITWGIYTKPFQYRF
jgi:hypothetical protein